MADKLQDVQDDNIIDASDISNPESFHMPSQEELLAAIEKLTGLDDETKQELRDGVLMRQKLGKLGEGASQFLPPAAENVKNTSLEVIMLLSLIAFVFLVLVMNKKTKLKSAQKIMNMFSMYKPEFKELLFKKIESRISEEKIKIVCTFVCIFSIGIFLLFFVFFGYKLYKSLVERERRREEKKRQKLQKKKK